MSEQQLSPDQSYVCADCKNIFLNPPRCTTCGAEKLYNATVKGQAETIEHLQKRLDEAVSLVNDYYWVESKSAGREVDKRAGNFLKRIGKL